MHSLTLVGTETEYGITCGGIDPAVASGWVIAELGAMLGTRHAEPDESLSFMAPTGARCYVDHAHPEYCTPECDSVTEAVLAACVGDALMMQAAARASRVHGQPIVLFRNTTDGKGSSYGHHENYLVPRSFDYAGASATFAGFLASRIVFTGAGRLGIGRDGGEPGFQLSSRADFFERVTSLETTLRRGIVNTRDEPLAGPGWRRVHVIAGDANLSQWARWATLATTQAALRVLIDGTRPPAPTDPVTAFHAWSHDPSLSRRVPCDDGVERTALELQRVWLSAASALGCEGVAEWRAVVDDLDLNTSRVADRVDWVAKLRVIESVAARRGLAPDAPELAAVDLQYGELSPRGLAALLTRSGALRRLISEADVQANLTAPLGSARARYRAGVLASAPDAVVAANWDALLLRSPQTGELVPIRLPDPWSEGPDGHW